METPIPWALEQLSALYGEEVVIQRERPLAGGSIHHVRQLRTNLGNFVIKWNSNALPHQFQREAEGLTAMRESGTPLVVPAPIAWSDDPAKSPYLVLEFVSPGNRSADFDAELGRGLAIMHRKTAAQFGAAHTNYCGATPQPNPWSQEWIPFFRAQRLGYQIERAASTRGWSRNQRRVLESLLERLEMLLASAPEPPALIHGDLWSGNVHTTEAGMPCLIDPAAYFGHREAELGMMALFGGFSPRVYAAYQEAFPLQAGWRRRVEVYSLYHVLNHYNLFGGGYGAQAVSLAQSLL